MKNTTLKINQLDDIKKLYERNKDIFVVEFKSIQYAEIKPALITGNSEYNEAFFKQLDIIENQVLDGESFEEVSKDNNLKIVNIKKINAKKEDQNKNKLNNISNALFKKFYNIKSSKLPEVINLDGKYYLVEIYNIEKKNKLINDPEVQKALNAQLNFKGSALILLFFPKLFKVTVFLLISQILSGLRPIIVYRPLIVPFSTDSNIKLFFSARRNLNKFSTL